MKSSTKTLEEGNLYNYRNSTFLVEIMAIKDNQVFYWGRLGTGVCSVNEFVRMCPFEVSEQHLDSFLVEKTAS